MTIHDDEYFDQMYGSRMGFFQEEPEFANAAEFYPKFGFGECYAGKDEATECNIYVGGGLEIDESLLTYDQKVARHFQRFCDSTSAHGISQVGNTSTHRARRAIWFLLWSGAMIAFSMQASLVIKKYNRNEKIVDIQLQFEAAPFPAITFCNLNPYKASVASNVNLVSRTLKAFDNAMDTAEGSAKSQEAAASGGGGDGGHSRRRKREDNVLFEPAYSMCQCTGEGEMMDCKAAKEAKPKSDAETASLCLCAFDRHSGDAWPCYPKLAWNKDECSTCDRHGYCNKQSDGGLNAACLCQSLSAFCVGYDGSSEILNLWEYYGDTEPTEDPAFLEALGFAGMTDEVAIVTKAKENIMFAMATLSMEERTKLSYQKREFVHKCSFNGKACDIGADFITHVDPIFGNCFTFNHNRTKNITSIRAGPMYGLRMVLYVNTTEYMPTTEAAGVRLTVHEKTEFPFPDTFGYSAPTGFISSFGIRLKRMERMPAPYGDCIEHGKTKDYIYTNYDYSVEGCFRSCFQQLVVHECGCGDPRFPVPIGWSHCQAADPVARKCLDARTKQLGGLHGSFRCRCQQPCKQATFTVTYSASRWPSESLRVQLGSCTGDPSECRDLYEQHGSMIEVFYEQLNFEMLTESEAYGWVNLLADFGGNLGLLLGVSVLTVFEFVFLLGEFFYMSGNHHYQQWKAKREKKKKKKQMRD